MAFLPRMHSLRLVTRKQQVELDILQNLKSILFKSVKDRKDRERLRKSSTPNVPEGPGELNATYSPR